MNQTPHANAAGAINTSPTPNSAPPDGHRTIPPTDALQNDPDLVSILDTVHHESGEHHPRQTSSSSVSWAAAKPPSHASVAQMIGFQCIDTDHLIIEAAGKNIPAIFAAESESGFRQRESAALRSLSVAVAAASPRGGIITQPRIFPSCATSATSSGSMQTPRSSPAGPASIKIAPLLAGRRPQAKLTRLLTERKPIYKSLADLRIKTSELTPPSAYGILESARVFFAKMRR
ncbi:MAG: hypothetical protein IPK32_26180 [Verrucomicrobiaceae bacterium]|nr:hypothetical protein [Verrucomicrobiaceae bacterium]